MPKPEKSKSLQVASCNSYQKMIGSAPNTPNDRHSTDATESVHLAMALTHKNKHEQMLSTISGWKCLRAVTHCKFVYTIYTVDLTINSNQGDIMDSVSSLRELAFKICPMCVL